MLSLDDRQSFGPEHALFRDQVRKLLQLHAVPNLERWEADGIVDPAFWRMCGEGGLLCPSVAAELGGLGLDFAFNAVVAEELAYIGCNASITLQSDVVCGYIEAFANDALKQRWLPAMVAGEAIGAIAMTEPDAGSDLKAIRTSAVRDGDDYVITGAKTYISNGQLADFVIVACAATGPKEQGGLTLILVEADRAGFKRGRKLAKIGQHAADTSELFFDDVRVPASNRIGDEGAGLRYLMNKLPQERLSIAVSAQASAQRAFDEALAFTKERRAFGQRVFDFQNSRFKLAELAAELQAGWAHLDWAIVRHVEGKLTAAQAAAAKYLHTELQWKCCDVALQLHGGAGYMDEYLISRLWRDARVTRIYGGTSEIMLEVIGRSL